MPDADIEEFRSRVRAFLDAHAAGRVDLSVAAWPWHHDTAGRRDRTGIEDARSFQAAAHAAGLTGLTWPREYGGQGLGIEYEFAYAEEAGR